MKRAESRAVRLGRVFGRFAAERSFFRRTRIPRRTHTVHTHTVHTHTVRIGDGLRRPKAPEAAEAADTHAKTSDAFSERWS